MNWLMTEMTTVRPMPARMNWSGWKIAVAKASVSNLTGLPERCSDDHQQRAADRPGQDAALGRGDRFAWSGQCASPCSLLRLVHLVRDVGGDRAADRRRTS